MIHVQIRDYTLIGIDPTSRMAIYLREKQALVQTTLSLILNSRGLMKLEKDKLVAVNVDIYKRKRERKKDKVKKITSQP